MIGLIIIFVFLVYLIVSFYVVRGVTLYAKGKGRSGWRWGTAAALFMYLLVFWDHIPTLILHEYYCSTKAGIRVYETPTQWEMRNPEIAETLIRKNNTQIYKSGGSFRSYKRNERFKTVDKSRKTKFFPVRIGETSIVDIETNTVMATIDFVSCGHTDNMEWYKFWLNLELCIDETERFRNLLYEFQTIGRVDNG